MNSFLMYFLLLSLCLSFTVVESNRSPIVFIPGILGSQFEAKINESYFNEGCTKFTKRDEWFRLWVDTQVLLPSFQKCFVNYMKLVYDNGHYMNNKGVQIKVPDFGGLSAVEFLTGDSGYSYLHEFVVYFEKFGYMKGKDLNAAPYDWRFAPDGLREQGYYDNLYQLIEDSYNKNNQTSVTLVAHSLGGPTVKYFLTTYLQDKDLINWKESRIKQFISLSGVFGGSTQALLSLLSGRVQFGITSFSRLLLRKMQRSFPSLLFMLPSAKLWNEKEVIVSTVKRNYTVQDYNELFSDAKYYNGTRMLNQFKNLSLYDVRTPPNVTCYCFYGNDIPTPSQFVYKEENSFPDLEPQVQYGNGDGTVNERSLKSCQIWKQTKPVILKSFTNVSHKNMISSNKVLENIKDLVFN